MDGRKERGCDGHLGKRRRSLQKCHFLTLSTGHDGKQYTWLVQEGFRTGQSEKQERERGDTKGGDRGGWLMLSVGLLRTRSNALEIPHRAHRHV
jgi:hypothetical protein